MDNSLFLDASFVIALSAEDDQFHAAAQSCWNSVLNDQSAMVTSSAILEEVATFLNSRNKHSLAVKVGNYLLESPSIDVIHLDAALFSAGWNYFVQHQDKRYSLTDCFSFLVMQQRGLRQALTFDKHFQQAGFELLPQTS